MMYKQTQRWNLEALALPGSGWLDVGRKLSREPQYSLSEAAALAGVSIVFIQNWRDRQAFPFDADIRRPSRVKHRRFSERDVELIRRVHEAITPQFKTVVAAAQAIDKILK